MTRISLALMSLSIWTPRHRDDAARATLTRLFRVGPIEARPKNVRNLAVPVPEKFAIRLGLLRNVEIVESVSGGVSRLCVFYPEIEGFAL